MRSKQEWGVKRDGYKLSSSAKIDCITKNNLDFQPFSFSKDHNPMAELEQNRPKLGHNLNLKFAGSSQYAHDFPDWR